VGHNFAKQGGTVRLVDYEITQEYVEAWGIISAMHYNIIVEGMISTDFMVEDYGLFNYFEVGADMKYDSTKMAADIANSYAKAAKQFIINTMRGEEPSNFSIALVPGVAQVTSKSRELIKGFMLGSVLAAGLLALLFVLDERPRTPEHISAAAGIPTLAVLPSRREMKRFRSSKRSVSRSGRRG
jgi:hypothetical protein